MTSWEPAPDRPRLPPGEVHVWSVSLSLPATEIRSRRQILSADERERADRFHFPRDGDRFIAARGALRSIIAKYTGEEPNEVRFRYGSHGKPYLSADPPPLMFNLAHSGELALVAVAGTGELGIDVERIRPKVSEEGIAERFFSAREVNAIRSSPPASQADAFFRCWTRKEALIKAIGKGLSFGLGQFTVSVATDTPAALLDTAFDPNEARRWTLHHIDPAPGYIGALAVPWVPETVRYWRFH